MGNGANTTETTSNNGVQEFYEHISESKKLLTSYYIRLYNINMLKTDFILYTTPKGDVRLEVFLKDETLWLTQKLMGELFDVGTNTVNYHLGEIFKSSELAEDSVIRKIRTTAKDGKIFQPHGIK